MLPNVLLIEDEPAALFGYSRYLGKKGFATVEAPTLAEAREALASRRFDAVILDMKLPDGSGMDFIPEIRDRSAEAAIVVITGGGDVPQAVEAMRRGADNFLIKPVDMSDLEVFLRKGLEVGRLRRKSTTSERLATKREPFFGVDEAMQCVREYAVLAAGNDSPMLILGETGVGKGVLARWIHAQGAPEQGPFVEVNCSSLRGELLASELFGHVKGAFTSAVQDRQGLLDVADGGTLFLDEVGDMDLAVQGQFLKVIEEKSYRRVGDVKVRQSNFRLISATNRSLGADVEAGRFRRDLFYRINVLPVEMPPLRARSREDFKELVSYVLEGLGAGAGAGAAPKAGGREVTESALHLLADYAWPGNVRELRNVLERALIISRGGAMDVEHFPGLVPGGLGVGAAAEVSKAAPATLAARASESIGEVTDKLIGKVLGEAGGDVNEAARRLGISRSTLYRRLKRLKQR